MSAHRRPELDDEVPPLEAVLTWLGGGDWRELAERHERSTHMIAGVVVLFGAVLAWLVATLAVAGTTDWPVVLVVPTTLVFGLLVGAVSRAIASGPRPGRPGVLGRAAIAVAVGLVVGELAAVVAFSGSAGRVLDERAARSADTTPAVSQAAADLDRTREARTALDEGVEQARKHRDEALVVARCEFNPSPACPETHITGIPGAGPETGTAQAYLTNAQRELDNALATRDGQAAALNAEIADREHAVAQAREAAMADADRGLGARWVAMNDVTLAGPGPLLLRALLIAFFALLSLLPLILKLWRGETSEDRGSAARVVRDRAELEADTAIAVKRAEVRAAVENLWAEQQLVRARLAVDAQTEIDRVEQQRRVMQAIEPAVRAQSQRIPEPLSSDDIFLPIAAEAEAVSMAAAEPENLPVRAASDDVAEREADSGGRPLIPAIPDVTKAAVRWIRPFVPPIITNAIDIGTRPLRGARQILEETEEIHFSLKRTRKVTLESDEGPTQQSAAGTDTSHDAGWVEAERDFGDHDFGDHGRLDARSARLSVAPRERQAGITHRGGRRELRGYDGPRQLPPGE
jgi:hypothetical protein